MKTRHQFVVGINGDNHSIPNNETSIIIEEEPKGIVVIGLDWALNVGFGVWGDPSYINESMLINYFFLYGNNVNKNNPLQMNGFAIKKVDWEINIAGEDGTIIDVIQVDHQSKLHEEWTPPEHVEDGIYTFYLTASDKTGFKVDAEPQHFTIKQEQ